MLLNIVNFHKALAYLTGMFFIYITKVHQFYITLTLTVMFFFSKEMQKSEVPEGLGILY